MRKTRLSYIYLPFRSLDEIHQMRRSRSPTRHHDASRSPADYRSRDMDSQYLSDQERYIISLNLEASLEMSLLVCLILKCLSENHSLTVMDRKSS